MKNPIQFKGLTHTARSSMVTPLHGLHTCARDSKMTASENGTDRRQRLKALREAALHRPVPAAQVTHGFNGRWTRRHWAHASLFATLGVLVAAIVPGFGSASNVQPLHAQRSSLALSLPPLPLARLKGHNGDSWQVVRIE